MRVKDVVGIVAILLSLKFLIVTSQDIVAEDEKRRTQERLELIYECMNVVSMQESEKKSMVTVSGNAIRMNAFEKTNENQMQYAITDTDEQMLMQLAMAEAEGEGLEGKALVILIVLNRVRSDEFPNSIDEVIFQETNHVKQFSTVEANGRYWTSIPDEECIDAIKLIRSGWDESRGALYFESCDTDSWQSRTCEYLFCHGKHKFYR